jgi:hypothetical protein
MPYDLNKRPSVSKLTVRQATPVHPGSAYDLSRLPGWSQRPDPQPILEKPPSPYDLNAVAAVTRRLSAGRRT